MKSKASRIIEQLNLVESTPLDKYTQTLNKFGFVEPKWDIVTNKPYLQYVQHSKDKKKKDLGSVIVTRSREGFRGGKIISVVINWLHVFGISDNRQQRTGTTLDNLIMSLENV